MYHIALPVIKKTIISASPIIVSTPFTALGLATFGPNEVKALWQPPNYVFGIAWPTLYFLLFSLNWDLLSNTIIKSDFKTKMIKNTLFESFFQGAWLYSFRYKKSIKGREKNQYFYGLINTSILVSLSFKTLYDLCLTNNLKYVFLYIPYFLWIQFANILNIQLWLGKTK